MRLAALRMAAGLRLLGTHTSPSKDTTTMLRNHAPCSPGNPPALHQPVPGRLRSGCAGQHADPQAVTLKMALLPVLDALPIYAAQSEGLFAARGIKVEFIPVASAGERDQLIAAGQADGMINEVLSTLFSDQDEPRVQIVRYARTATAQSALFRILAAKNSGITSVDGLKGVPVGISDGTVIAYLTDRLLQASGFKPEEIKTVAVPKIPDRLALLNTGELKAAMLPDPTTALAIQSGASVVLDDTLRPELSFSTIAFRKEVLDQHPEAVRAFLAAIEEATARINTNPGGWGEVLAAQKLIPDPLIQDYQVPPFVTAGVPTQAQFDDVVAWAKDKGLLTKDVAYTDCVNASFLP